MSANQHFAVSRASKFCNDFNLLAPILLAPMAGACPPGLSIAVANAGGMGSCAALLLSPDKITNWVDEVRAGSNGAFQINLWIPDPPAHRDALAEDAVRAFLRNWGPEVERAAGDMTPPDFAEQCEAMLAAGPAVMSSIMGLYPPPFVDRMKARGIKWFATATTVGEAIAAEAAGADAIISQGMEAGGHRGAFDPSDAEAKMIGLFALLPAVVDAVKIPVIAAGGIADPRGVAAALILGASAVQVGTGFLRSPEANIPGAWADALVQTRPENTMISRAFSGRAGRAIANAYARAASMPDSPAPAPYPVQRGLTAAMREAAVKANNIGSMQAWAGQSAAMARRIDAGEIVRWLWQGAQDILGG